VKRRDIERLLDDAIDRGHKRKADKIFRRLDDWDRAHRLVADRLRGLVGYYAGGPSTHEVSWLASEAADVLDEAGWRPPRKKP
jgi:hypothetical protein